MSIIEYAQRYNEFDSWANRFSEPPLMSVHTRTTSLRCHFARFPLNFHCEEPFSMSSILVPKPHFRSEGNSKTGNKIYSFSKTLKHLNTLIAIPSSLKCGSACGATLPKVLIMVVCNSCWSLYCGSSRNDWNCTYTFSKICKEKHETFTWALSSSLQMVESWQT